MKTWYRFDFGNGHFVEKEFNSLEDFYDYVEHLHPMDTKDFVGWTIIKEPK